MLKSKLLILGAGIYGHLVEDLARDIGYTEVAFLDDFSDVAIGKLDDYIKYKNVYEEAVVAIDEFYIREKYINKLVDSGFKVPSIIHPKSYVSASAVVGGGTVVEPMAVINVGCNIGKGCIVEAGAVLGTNAVVGDYSHIAANSTILYNCVLKPGTRTTPGELFGGDPKLIGTKAWLPNYSFDDGV